MKIRKAESGDKKAWTRMRYTLWPTTEKETLAEELSLFFEGRSLDISNAFILVNESGDHLGFLEINIRNYAEGSENDRVPYVEGWFIDDRYRGRGLGSKLMLYVENWARESGFTELASDTTLENTGSIRLHKKLGFKEQERVVCFLKPLTSLAVEDAISRDEAIEIATSHWTLERSRAPDISDISISKVDGEWWVRFVREKPETKPGKFVRRSPSNLTIAVDISSGKVRGPFGR